MNYIRTSYDSINTASSVNHTLNVKLVNSSVYESKNYGGKWSREKKDLSIY